MDCREVRDNLELYLLGELPPPQARDIEGHLASCPSCRAESDAAAGMLRTLDDILAPQGDRDDLVNRTVSHVARRQRAILLRRSAAAAAAACVIVTILAWWALRPGPDGTTRIELIGCRVTPIAAARFEVIAPRRIRLHGGEIFLDARPGSEPLTVETPAGAATALGTRFYVGTGRPKEQPDMKTRFVTTVLVLSGTVQLANAQGAESASAGEALIAVEGSAPKRHVEDLARRFAGYYKPVKARAAPAVPAYKLPLDLTGIANFRKVAGALGLAGDEPLLRRNGFVVVPLPPLEDEDGIIPRDDVVRAYKALKEGQVPVFVTADTLLHLYHVQFGETLRDVEERELSNDLVALSGLIAAEAGDLHAKSAGEPKEAARLLLAYGTVGRMLLEGLGDAGLVETAAAALKEISSWTIGETATNAQFRFLMEHSAVLEAALGGEAHGPEGWQEGAKRLIGALEAFIKKHKDAAEAIPQAVARQVRAELARIGAHSGFSSSPIFTYQEDYSQYVPRGHYTRSFKLRRYFQAMMWYGRMAFILRGGEPYGRGDEPFLVSQETAARQTLAAAMLTNILTGEKLPDGRTAKEVWERAYAVTAFYVGLADDLGVQEYDSALTAVIGPGGDPGMLADKGTFQRLQLALARHSPPTIYGGTGGQYTNLGPRPQKLLEALDKSTGFRLMGRRFAPDSYAMGRLVFPAVGRPTKGTDVFTCSVGARGPVRGFPRGLDVMALLGSRRARQLLAELRDDAYGRNDTGGDLKYQAALRQLKAEFDALSESDWTRNAYWSWLHALKPLLAEFGGGYPTFMRTEAWRNKSMTAALASWAQLRHDTILYAKESYAPAGEKAPQPKPVEGYVEPAPAFYARMLALTQMTRRGLEDMKIATGPAIKRLTALEKIIARLLAISLKELAHQKLTKDDYTFIRDFGERLAEIHVDYPDGSSWPRRDEIKEAMRTTIVAGVHTDQNSGQVLQEGTGHVDLMAVCYLQPDGRLALGAGPVLSYYEFKHPISDRLTDEKWRRMLRAGKAPKRPEWVGSYLRE